MNSSQWSSLPDFSSARRCRRWLVLKFFINVGHSFLFSSLFISCSALFYKWISHVLFLFFLEDLLYSFIFIEKYLMYWTSWVLQGFGSCKEDWILINLWILVMINFLKTMWKNRRDNRLLYMIDPSLKEQHRFREMIHNVWEWLEKTVLWEGSDLGH